MTRLDPEVSVMCNGMACSAWVTVRSVAMRNARAILRPAGWSVRKDPDTGKLYDLCPECTAKGVRP